MQMPCFHIWWMLLSGQVAHRTNSSNYFGIGYSRRKNATEWWGREEGVRIHLFWKKSWNCLGFSLYLLEISSKTKLHLWKFGKIVYVNPSEMPRPKTKTSGNFTWIFLGLPWLFHIVLINSWKCCMLFLEFPWKFYILKNLPSCLSFFQNSPISKTLC